MASFLRQLSRSSLVGSIQRTSKATSRPVAVFGNGIVKSSVSSDKAAMAALQQSTTCTMERLIHSTSTVSDDDKAKSAELNIPDLNTIREYQEDIHSMTNDELNDPTTIPGFATLIHSRPKDRDATPRNAKVGVVVSTKMQKTVNVAVDRYRIVPKYRKRKKYTKKFMAHDEEELCREGDLVMIVPCQKISKRKHFMVHEIVKVKGTLQERKKENAA